MNTQGNSTNTDDQTKEKLTRSFFLPHYIVYLQELSLIERLILIVFIEREDNFKGESQIHCGKEFYITQDWLASQTGISVSSIKRAVSRLESAKIIQRRRKRGEATHYSINWSRLNHINTHFKFLPQTKDDIDVEVRQRIEMEVMPELDKEAGCRAYERLQTIREELHLFEKYFQRVIELLCIKK